MRPETRLGVGIGLTLVLTVASFAVHAADGSSAVLPPVSTDGAAVFQTRGCSGCHTVDGSGGSFGPDLSDLASRADDRVPGVDAHTYVRQSIREPQAFVVPGYTGVHMPTLPLSDQELNAVASFLLRR